MKTLFKGLFAIGFLLFLAVGGSLAVFLAMNRPVVDSALQADSDIHFTVYEGESISQIAARLDDEGLIRSALFLRTASKLLGTESRFRSGVFVLNPSMSTLRIHDALIYDPPASFPVTIPEGLTMRETAEALETASITSAVDFLEACRSAELMETLGVPSTDAEGFLFPDTYRFTLGSPAETVLRVIVANFFSHLEVIYPEYRTFSPRELRDAVILASVIEKEYRIPEEAPIIASVFKNRLRLGMPLGADATIKYVIMEILGRPRPDRIFFEDLEIDNPYNTYLYTGLPPGPIASPGVTTLRAALFPAETDYLYYLLRNPETGEHVFNRTYEEHLRAYDLYIR